MNRRPLAASDTERVLWVMDGAPSGEWIRRDLIQAEAKMAPKPLQEVLWALLKAGTLERMRVTTSRKGRPAHVYRRRIAGPPEPVGATIAAGVGAGC